MKFVTYNHPTKGEMKVPIDPGFKTPGALLGQKSTDYFAGKIGSLPFEIRNKSRDWRNWVVLGEKQWYPNFDSNGCTGFGVNNSAEIQLKFETGIEYNFSDEAINWLAECMVNGNYLYKPVDWARNNGRILQRDWTILNPKSWNDYHKPVPLDVQKKAIKFNESSEWIDTSRASLEYHLAHAPIILIIQSGSMYHIVVLLHISDEGLWYFDSYEPWLKVTTQYPTSALKLIVKPMTNSFLIQVNKKDGSKELAMCAPAIDGNALIDKSLNTGYPLPTLNNGKEVDWPNVQPRFIVNE